MEAKTDTLARELEHYRALLRVRLAPHAEERVRTMVADIERQLSELEESAKPRPGLLRFFRRAAQA